MGQINGWNRTKHHSNLDSEEVQKQIDERGQALIASWWHPDARKTVEYIYRRNAENPFVVKLKENGVTIEEKGPFTYRYEGDEANKDLMRNVP